MVENVLITGGAGFIGSNLTIDMQKIGYNVSVFDNLSRGFVDYLPSKEILFQGDIRDTDYLSQVMQEFDAVIHLAAYGSVVESVAEPQPNFDINVNGTFSVLEAARRSRIKKFIFASTGGALIGEAKPPVDEMSLPKPISPYGASKLCGEAYCHAFAKAYDMQTVCLRFANVYGPHSSHKKGAATKFMKCILKGEPIPIFGDGSSTRDFLHVKDLCEGIIMAFEKDVQCGEVFHLASGVEMPILDLARIITNIAGDSKYPIQFWPARTGEVKNNFARYQKAKEELGFEPKKDLRQGLEETWHWYQTHKDQVLSVQESDS